MLRPPCPVLEYELGPCPQCGARDMDEAHDMCRPNGSDDCGGRFNDDGMNTVPTKASIKAVERFIEARILPEALPG